MDILNPARDMMLRLTPSRYIIANDATNERGMERLIIPALDTEPRKNVSTTAASRIACTAVSMRSFMEPVMNLS